MSTLPPLGHTILHFEAVDSTNTLAQAQATGPESHGTVFLARHQQGGRGREGRVWVSVPGMLQFSLIIHLSTPQAQAAMLSLGVGLAIAEAIEETTGLPLRVKWPNDVYCQGAKLCGVLIESGKAKKMWVVGMGINCNNLPEDFPPEFSPKPATLKAALGEAVDEEALLAAILGAVETLYHKLEQGQGPQILQAWEAHSPIQGQRVRWQDAGLWHTGTALGLDAQGGVRIALADGSTHTHLAGPLQWEEAFLRDRHR